MHWFSNDIGFTSKSNIASDLELKGRDYGFG